MVGWGSSTPSTVDLARPKSPDLSGDVPAILDDIRDDFSKRAGDCSQ